jgi:NADP-dependent 3-hydroxy acid dehydrogenase YdfG
LSQLLPGAVALVTGASSGIGEATARALAAQGAGVVLVARRTELLEAIADSIREAGGRALVVVADITRNERAAAAVAAAIAEYGRLDIVVNNAGLMLVGPVADAPDDEWDRMIDVNLRGVLSITRAALPHLIEAAQSSSRAVADIVNISSTAGRVPGAGYAVYSLTKFGVNAFSEGLRQEVRPQSVRVGTIMPGTVDTELRTHMRDELRAGVEASMSGMEKLRSQDIADAVVFMVSRERRAAVNEILLRASDQSW